MTTFFYQMTGLQRDVERTHSGPWGLIGGRREIAYRARLLDTFNHRPAFNRATFRVLLSQYHFTESLDDEFWSKSLQFTSLSLLRRS